MPKGVPVTFRAFQEFEEKICKLGFSEMSRKEIAIITEAHGLVPPRSPQPGEIGFKYSAHGYTVKVWTSCVRAVVEKCRKCSAGQADDVVVSREIGGDMGWVLIVDAHGSEQYFSRPVLRTANFVRNILRRTWIAQRRIDRRPLCPECRKYLVISRNKHGGFFWGCYHAELHSDGRPRFAGWDVALPPRALKYAKMWREEFARYRRSLEKQGKKPRRAASLRKPWRSTRDPY